MSFNLFLFSMDRIFIEPPIIGQKRFMTDDMSSIIEVVRQEGIEIAA